ncbi:L-rhamnose isomerase [Opitutia bacterium ISCC 51]|nr:L-rhamnose isomerase [Verrucomicrobiota bacterium]QXD23520.1 L-rhamnose isomerase [Opitutae bacterium ISCC 51]QXD27592.1 L-rhamnose isomerase [Opitutae bacterium ISCC 52]
MNTSSNYELAKEQYAAIGVDTDTALERLATIPISVHCWQGDDVAGFEGDSGITGGGIMATGNYPGRARTIDELRTDLEKVYSIVPGKHRLNLHASYLDHGGQKVDRTDIEEKHFQSWADWAKTQEIGLDFNPTYFSHPLANDGFTLAHPDKHVRDFWIEHGKRCRKIGAFFGRELENTCVTNIWIPDGLKDTPADRRGPRELLTESLDATLAESLDPTHNLDAVECKLFGLGSESYVVGSHEFYMGYAIKNQTVLCLDAGHFHPTESIADKISSVMFYVPRLLLHVSRGVRWDSDHVIVLNDDLQSIARELVVGDYLDRTHVGLDFFDASINRVAAWSIGTRNILRALLVALLEPTNTLQEAERKGDFTSRMALFESLKTMPFGAVWNQYCETNEVPLDGGLMDPIREHEKNVLSQRNG